MSAYKSWKDSFAARAAMTSQTSPLQYIVGCDPYEVAQAMSDKILRDTNKKKLLLLS